MYQVLKNHIPSLRRLLYPKALLLIPLIVGSAASLAVVFISGTEKSAFAVTAYLISAYTTSALTLRVIDLAKKTRHLVHQNHFLHRYLTETAFKTEVSLCLSLGINLSYSIYKAVSGLYYHSLWFGTMAFYYMVLSTVRFHLLHSFRQKQSDRMRLFRKYRFCGCLLLVLIIAITGMGLHTAYGGTLASYPGYMIYAAAGYAFYSLATAIINFIKYRKESNPVYSAAKAITLAAALVSMFSLQTAMLSEFGASPSFQRQMNILTGLGVFIMTATMALYMILRGSCAVRQG
ncbi:hypothetical protein [Anaerolentibacter hominis]|uniref:hypothetical protein n=1 Tax=Anaerolentibacter hominis TaxID=3079009 RepID=UPI0031B7FF79